MRELTFSPSRAVEYVLFLASNLREPTIHEVLKLRYFADKLHLSRYGMLPSGDNYVAMQFGPVGSNTYNLLKAARGEKNAWIHPAFFEAVLGSVRVEGKKVHALRAADTSKLSPSDLECLVEALERYGGMGFAERAELSHDRAWTKARNSAADNQLDADQMSLLDITETLDNSEEVKDHLLAD